jgi:hypothetical protein
VIEPATGRNVLLLSTATVVAILKIIADWFSFFRQRD